MNKFFTILALLLTVTAVFGQRRINPAKQLYVAPDSAYILYSDSLGEFQIRRLIDVLPPGTGGGTLTDNGDGTYTYISGGDTTIVNTQADNVFTTANITIGGNTFTAGSNIQQIIQAFVGGDTITQTGHGFFAGTMVGQEPGNGDYFAARASVPDSFPVAFVSQVINANTFVIQNEGWLTWAHGRPAGTDYFLQDNGTFATTPDSTYAIFGFRTFGTDKAYFDVPELVVSFGPGGSPVINNPVTSVTTVGDTTLRVEYYNGDVDNYEINGGADIYAVSVQYSQMDTIVNITMSNGQVLRDTLHPVLVLIQSISAPTFNPLDPEPHYRSTLVGYVQNVTDVDDVFLTIDGVVATYDGTPTLVGNTFVADLIVDDFVLGAPLHSVMLHGKNGILYDADIWFFAFD